LPAGAPKPYSCIDDEQAANRQRSGSAIEGVSARYEDDLNAQVLGLCLGIGAHHALGLSASVARRLYLG
jgi:hypothetical protein